jgi:hypothetical protein
MKVPISIIDRIFNKLGYTHKKFDYTPKDRLQALLEQFIPLQLPLTRVGAEADGGYLIPTELPLPTAIFSPGVNDSDTFEVYFANKGVPCYLADFSVETNPTPHPRIHFIKKFVGLGSEDFITLEDWIRESVGNELKGMLLQMDIEGWEYHNLINTSKEMLSRFDCLCIEFHGFNRLGNWKSFDVMKEVFEKILADFAPVHVHANNCCGYDEVHGYILPTAIEMTFVNRNSGILTDKSLKVNNLNHDLNVPCDNLKEEITLNSWLKN